MVRLAAVIGARIPHWTGSRRVVVRSCCCTLLLQEWLIDTGVLPESLAPHVLVVSPRPRDRGRVGVPSRDALAAGSAPPICTCIGPRRSSAVDTRIVTPRRTEDSGPLVGRPLDLLGRRCPRTPMARPQPSRTSGCAELSPASCFVAESRPLEAHRHPTRRRGAAAAAAPPSGRYGPTRSPSLAQAVDSASYAPSRSWRGLCRSARAMAADRYFTARTPSSPRWRARTRESDRRLQVTTGHRLASIQQVEVGQCVVVGRLGCRGAGQRRCHAPRSGVGRSLARVAASTRTARRARGSPPPRTATRQHRGRRRPRRARTDVGSPARR